MTRRSRALPSATTASDTPWALKIVTEPEGISSRDFTKTVPRERRSSRTCLLWTISCRTNTGAP